MAYTNVKLQEFNNELKGKKVAIIGLGVSNLPLIEYLYNLDCKITVFDKRELEKIDEEMKKQINRYRVETSLGEEYLSGLTDFAYIFRSPSCMPNLPELEKAVAEGAVLTSEIEMVMKLCPGTIIGITGSTGKTTTTSLIYEIAKTKKESAVYLGGNIGIPLFTKLSEIKPEDVIVLELSSFQLMNMEVSPHVALVLNISANHLDIHSSFDEYVDAKKNIFKNQNKNDILVLNYDNDKTRAMEKESSSNIVFFSSETKLDNGYIVDNGVIKYCKDGVRRHIVNTDELILRGMHNYENVLAALAATADVVDLESQIKAIKDFKGVEHRLEFVREIDGAKWYNDSKATAPTSTIAAINAFDEDIVLIAGGYDKHLDYEPIAKPIVERVNSLILLGATAEKIQNAVKRELENYDKDIEIYRCKSLEESIEVAKSIAKAKDIVLFSPASASFDMFKNFEQRGEIFKELVNKI